MISSNFRAFDRFANIFYNKITMLNSKHIYILVDELVNSQAISVRERNALKHRYGLGADKKPKTLQWIGDKFKTSRERIRQIKERALNKLRKVVPENFEREMAEVEKWLNDRGVVVDTETLLDESNETRKLRNALVFLSEFHKGVNYRERDNKNLFNERWYSLDNEDLVNCIENSLNSLYKKIDKQKVISEKSEFLSLFKDCMDAKLKGKFSEENAFRWLKITDRIKQNQFGEYGRAGSPFVKFNSTKHRLIYVLRDNEKPMHFRDLWKASNKKFKCGVGMSTCHNELIRSPEFILVGKGKYALAGKNGMTSGTVKDRVHRLLKKNGAMTKEKIIEEISRECSVERNTIINALYNENFFKKNRDGRWKAA